MLTLFQDMALSWIHASARTLTGLYHGMQEPFPRATDPPSTTPFTIIYEEGKVSLRYYPASKKPHPIPLLIVYALIKRPFILDLLPNLSVIENLTRQGFNVYLIDWIPPTQADAWRGFESYVNTDMANAVRAVQAHSNSDQISLLGYCFGALLSAIYTALHPASVKHLVTLAVPVDGSKQDIAAFSIIRNINPELVVGIYKNCPAWIMKVGFSSMSPVHHLLHKHVGRHRNKGRAGYVEMFELFERWMNSDVPLAGQIFCEVTRDIFQRNLLAQEKLRVGKRLVRLQNIRCPVLNIVGANDDVVHPQASLPLTDLVGSIDKETVVFPAGHIGLVVSGSTQRTLWPQVGSWLKQRGSKRSRRAQPIHLTSTHPKATVLAKTAHV